MSNSGNILDRDSFLENYLLKDIFLNSGLSWEILESIYQDYNNSLDEVVKVSKKLEQFCKKEFSSEISYHSLRCRAKDPEHLIEKIIRKRGKEQNAKYKDINSHNYKEIVRDLIGVRILVISKEEWESIYDKLVHIFPKSRKSNICMAEEPIAYIRYGDRDVYKDKIKLEYSNKGYRSQHYIVKFSGFYCEIQVRTLAEEVFGEFDHMVKYPYRNDNNFLLRYTNTLSKLTDSIDEIMSTCFQLGNKGWEQCAESFSEDVYRSWDKTSQSKRISEISETKSQSELTAVSGNSNNGAQINLCDFANEILLRKG